MRTIIYALLLLVVVAGGFYAYQQFIVPSPDEALVSEEVGSVGLDDSQASQVSDLLSILQTLQGLSINTQLFENPMYQALRDFSVVVRQQPQGRPNPFAAF